MTERLWAPGAATGIGSLPGSDPHEASALVFGELPDLPHLAELPERGPGADMIGRGAALLAELPVELVPTGWRIAAHAGADLRRARDFLARDLDALEQAAEGWTGPLKVQVPGPWTLAATLELPTGHRMVSDHGAARELVESLTEGLRAHLADIVARVPGAHPVLQLDEPSLSAVLEARVPTPSGYGTARAVPKEVVRDGLRTVLSAAAEGARVVHSCAADVPIRLLHESGADAVALDAALLRTRHYDALGELVDAGRSLWLGIAPTTGAEATLDTARKAVLGLWGDLGFAVAELAGAVVCTPACGLAGASPQRLRRTLRTVREVGRSLLDEQ